MQISLEGKRAVVTAGAAGILGFPNRSPYVAAKWAAGYTQGWSNLWRWNWVLIISVCQMASGDGIGS